MAMTDEQLAKVLIQKGIVDAATVREAAGKRTPQKGLAQVLLESGAVSEKDLKEADPSLGAGARAGMGFSLRGLKPSPEALDLVDISYAKAKHLFPVSLEGNTLRIAMANPHDLPTIDEISRVTGCRVAAVGAPEAEIMQAIGLHYASEGPAPTESREETFGQPLESDMEMGPAVRYVDAIIKEAVELKASDIHLEPRADGLYLRYRVDGVLRSPRRLDKAVQASILSRIKVLCNLDLAEQRVPQDGRFRQIVAGRTIDFRVSTLPLSLYESEKIVLRLLDKGSISVSLDQLGFQPEVRTAWEQMALKPQGMILVTGPTGSGKSTTLYATLNFAKSDAKNIVTVEDPIEYQVDGINQTQVNPVIDLTFARQLRAILRQDPDVILVGEIRDLETAEMAFRAAMTGHLVLSTLHTNDAPSTAVRLRDMGVEGYLVASSVVGILAQRLVRVNCSNCKEEYHPSEYELSRLGIPPEQARTVKFHRGTGCEQCGNTGYKGRIGVYELMAINDSLRHEIVAGATGPEIAQAAARWGMHPLIEDGLLKMHQGITTAEEISRVLFIAEE